MKTIVTVDDDRHYPRHLFEALHSASAKYPGSVICGAGRSIRTDESGRLLPYSSWPVEAASATAILPLGCAGVLYPPGCFHADVDRPDIFTELAPTTDDLWFKVMSYLRGTPSISLGWPMSEFIETLLYSDTGLWAHNRLGPDDTNMARLIEHYRIDPQDFAAAPRIEPIRASA